MGMNNLSIWLVIDLTPCSRLDEVSRIEFFNQVFSA